MLHFIPLISKEIGVGLLVGLISAIGIGIYNRYKNRDEIKQEKASMKSHKKLVSIVTDKELKLQQLLDLKDSGIITEEEVESKAKMLNDNIINGIVVESQEYKQLKELFDKGIFNENEFKDKVNIIRAEVRLNYETEEEQESRNLILEEEIFGKWANPEFIIKFKDDHKIEMRWYKTLQVMRGYWSITGNKIRIDLKSKIEYFDLIKLTNHKLEYKHNKTTFKFDRVL